MKGITRFLNNPVLSSAMVTPSRPDLKVVGIFNCGAVKRAGEVILLCRVAEAALGVSSEIRIPVLGEKSGFREIEIESYDRSSGEYDYSDSRSFRRKTTGRVHRLTSISHLRLARSADGYHFTLDSHPWFSPQGAAEEWGVEDPRITYIEDRYYITYSSIARDGVTASLASTVDFNAYSRHGVIFPPTNKDAALFPQKIDGRFCALHRPVPCEIGELSIWLSYSDNLTDWGCHRLLLRPRWDWEADRVGVGAVPILTERGWLVMYHAADRSGRYSAGLLLLDADDPAQVIARTEKPFFAPETDYEKNGFFPNVVFPCGLIPSDSGISVYYGAADDKICLLEADWTSVWNAFEA